MEDKKLVRELKRRNPAALEYIITTYAGGLHGLVSRIITNPQDIEECVSDVLVAAWDGIGNYDPKRGSFKTWLLVLAKYKALDYRRRSMRTVETAVENVPAPNHPGAEVTVLAQHRADEVLEIVNTLPELDRKIIQRRYFLYEDIQEIARNLGLSRSAVDTRLWRARKLLKDKLNDGEGLGCGK